MHASDPPADPEDDAAEGPRQALAALREEFKRWGIIHDAQGTWRAVRGRVLLRCPTAGELREQMLRAGGHGS